MLVIPAIDVQGGRCAALPPRASSGPHVATADPAVAARALIDAGATRLHVADIDAARGTPARESVDSVGRVVNVCVGAGCAVQVAGGVRDVDSALQWLEAGASLVVLGSVAAREPNRATEICAAANGRVLLDLEVRMGAARAQGWTEDGLAATELLRRWRRWRTAGLVYTDATRENLLNGPNLDGLQVCRELYGGPVILSGGIGSLDHITACAQAGASGVVLGKALFEGRVDLATAVEAAASMNDQQTF